jgi:hypothetical protein
MSESKPYQAHVNQLLESVPGYKLFQNEWLDYSALFGFTVVDLPELIRLSLDEDPPHCETDEYMFHGLIAVAQLDPVAAINLYLQQLHLFEDDDLLMGVAKDICRNAGKVAIEPCVRFLKNTEEDEWYRTAISDGLVAIAEADPDSRDACIQVLMEQLRLYQQEDNDIVNSVLVDNLVRLKAVEAADLIQEVFTQGDIDEFRTGSWPRVQVELGLKSESDFTPEELRGTPPPELLALRESLDRWQELQDSQKRQEVFGQKSLNFSVLKTPKPKSIGFGSSQPRPKKNNLKKK